MKRILFILPLLLNVYTSNAQRTGGFEPQLKVFGAYGFDKHEVKSIGATLIGGIRTSEQSWVGLGVGYYEAKHIFPEGKAFSPYDFKQYKNVGCYPIFVSGKYNWGNKVHWLPYMGLEGGFIIYNYDNTKVGIFIKPAIGMDYRFGKNTLSFEIGYQFHPSIMDVDSYSQLTTAIGYSWSF